MLFRTLAATKNRSNIAAARLIGMAAHLANGSANGHQTVNGHSGAALRDLPKSNVFTENLPPDPMFPTPAESHKVPREKLGPRMVRNALYTFVRPQPVEEPELLGVSPRAMRDIGIREGEEETDEFKEIVAGNKVATWDEEKEEGIYPWAQCYGGWQFGNWASQLGDGRAISLFETTNPQTGKRYEIQLKGAGKTPYSRFADGKAVLRSSLREYVVSESLNALGIPTTRALSLTFLPKAEVSRERLEPGAIVARFAETWIRIGTFDLLRNRGDRLNMRRLAEYVAEHNLGGWEALPARVPVEELKDSSPEAVDISRGVPRDELQGPEEKEENRFARLYREIVRRNARTVAWWQAYAFTNGVLNTDNTSVYGLSIDFGPFAFLDNFDPQYTPNHDDFMLRYSYRNQPTIIWWNLVRLGEDLGELLGAGRDCDDDKFIEKGVSEEYAPKLIKRAESIIDRAGEEYKAVFMAEYRDVMRRRLGLKHFKEDDFKNLLSDWLDIMEALELDFNHSFRRLSDIKLSQIETNEQRTDIAPRFFHKEGVTGVGENEDTAKEKIGEWLGKWRERLVEDWKDVDDSDAKREKDMKQANPKFIPRSWILDELIDRVEKKGEREILSRVLHMALNPFEDEWGWNKEEEERFCGDVPKHNRAMQCSCSS